MRSDLVYAAHIQIHNRFLLSTVVMHAIRKLHINSTRTEDTANHVFSEVAQGRYIQVKLAPVAPPPTIEPLLITPAA
jgi:hypothetical protein